MAAGILEAMVILWALATFTRLFDKMSDRGYMFLSWFLGFGGGGLLGMMPDLAGYFVGNHNLDVEHPILSSLCGFHYELDWLYAVNGWMDNSITDYVVCLLIFILVAVAITALLGLTDAAVNHSRQSYTIPASEAATLRGSLKRAAAYTRAYPAQVAVMNAWGIGIGFIPVAAVGLGLAFGADVVVYGLLYCLTILASLDFICDAVESDSPWGTASSVVILVWAGVPVGAWLIACSSGPTWAYLYEAVILGVLVGLDMVVDRFALDEASQRRRVRRFLSKLPKEAV